MPYLFFDGYLLLSSTVLKSPLFYVLFLIAWLVLLIVTPANWHVITQYWQFSGLGILGAIFANATGAGGGVVFIPAFNQLHFTAEQAIATSFSIQCFGMTAGAITWHHHYQTAKKPLYLWHSFYPLILVTTVFALFGLWLANLLHWSVPESLHTSFSWFSLLLGAGLIATLYAVKPEREHSHPSVIDWLLLALLSFIGGIITAWLSVGVGELIAIYLILRRFDVTMAVAIAVINSAICVWNAIGFHLTPDFNVVWQVTVFAGPGAIIGGIFAKSLVTMMSARKLKLFFAVWLLIIGASGVL